MYMSKDAPHAPPISGLEEAIAKTQATRAGASPTGVPTLPPKAVPWLMGLVGVALVAARTLPLHTVAAQLASGLVDVAVLFGLASPGWRRK